MIVAENNTPSISIILPVFNAEKYLDRCIRSILDQSFNSFELIAIDDGSTDSSAEILDRYSIQHSNNVHVFHKENEGVAKTRNFGLSQSKGDYICFIDNDDWFDCDYLSTLYSTAVDLNSDIVCSGYRRPDVTGKTVTQQITMPNSVWGKYIVSAAWAKLFKRSLIVDTNARFLDTNIGEDIYFTLPLIQASRNTSVINYIGYNWFYNKNSVSNTSHRKSYGLNFVFMMDETLEKLRSIDALDMYSTYYFVRLCVWFLLYTVKGDRFDISTQNLDILYQWLSVNLPNWKENDLGSYLSPSGDLFLNRVAVSLFINHPFIFKLCLRLYGAL